jgi:hypothetical protein
MSRSSLISKPRMRWLAEPVGWLERSETHHLGGFAVLHP